MSSFLQESSTVRKAEPKRAPQTREDIADEIAYLDEQIDALRDQIVDLKEQVVDLNDEIEILVTQREDLQGEISDRDEDDWAMSVTAEIAEMTEAAK